MAEEIQGASGTPESAPVAAPAVAPSTPAAAPAEAPVVDKQDVQRLTRREQIAHAMAKNAEKGGDTSLRQRMIEKGLIRPANGNATQPTARGAHAAHQPREQGKFAGPPQKPPVRQEVAQAVRAAVQANGGTPAEAPAIAPVQAAPQVQKPALPKWLAKEYEPHWNQAPAELLSAFEKYSTDAHNGVEKYKTAAQERDALLAEFTPYEPILRAENATPQTAMRNLLKTAAMLRTGSQEEKVNLVARMMQQFNVPFAHVAQMYGVQLQGPDGQPVQVPREDPELAALKRELFSLKSTLQGSQEATQQAENARLAKIAESFGKDRPHYDQLKPQIAKLLNAGVVEDVDGKSEIEILQAAYDMALRLNPELYAQSLAQERERAAQAEREKANQAAQQARAAAVQVRGAPGGSASAPNFDPKDRRSVIRHALQVGR